LREGLEGDLIRPEYDGFSDAKLLYNPRFDGTVPAAVVRAANTSDVAETIGFARMHGLDLRARSGGHSYVGASSVTGGITLDLSSMHRIDHRPADQQVRVQAGARLFDVHAALDPAGRSIPTGTCPTVGVAGLTLGGGVGVESRANGLSCDALESLVMVTADGIVHHVDAQSDPELFWASRGGGGGSMGVVTEMTFRTFAAQDMDFFFLRFAGSDAEAVIGGWRRRLTSMPRTSWANVHVDAVAGGGLDVRVVGLSLTGEGHQEASAMVAAVGRDATRTTGFTRSHHDGVRLLAGCSALTDAECAPAPAGRLGRESFVAGGDIVGKSLTDSGITAAVAHVRARASQGGGGTLILDPLGGRIGDVGPADTAFRWRQATGIAQWYVPMPSAPSRSATRAAYTFVRDGHGALGKGSLGGYVNYLEPGRPLRAYYGANFARLRSIKAEHDPQNLFRSGYAIPPAATH
jgi:FAD/FMN-containing dehydrogenase